MTAAAMKVAGDDPSQDLPKRVFIAPNAVPADALRWQGRPQREDRLRYWRVAVGRAFPEAPRVLRVAWLLDGLFHVKSGFAFCTDAFLESQLGIPTKKIQAALQDLEKHGAVIRASVMDRGRAQRRVWPSVKIVRAIFPTMGRVHLPHDGSDIFPTMGGENIYNRNSHSKTYRRSSTADDARREAERRERRERERGSEQL